jgi:hypothetical protein
VKTFHYQIVFEFDDILEEDYDIIDTIAVFVPLSRISDTNVFVKKIYDNLLSIIPANMTIKYDNWRGRYDLIDVMYRREDLTLNDTETYTIYILPYIKLALSTNYHSSTLDPVCCEFERDYTFLVVGPHDTGKSCWINRVCNGTYPAPIKFSTHHSCQIANGRFNITFIESNELRCDSHIDGIIIMFNLKSDESYCEAQLLKYECASTFSNVPIVFCGNMYMSSVALLEDEEMLKLPFYKFYDTCKFVFLDGKSMLNLDQPFVYLITNILKNECKN